MQPEIVILIAVLAILVIGAVIAFVYARRRSGHLRERFGPEYERTVGDGRFRGERELASRERRVQRLDIRPLDPDQRDEFALRWRDIQAEFVNAPGEAVRDANTLVHEVMRKRGYPVEDFDQREADLSVDHAGVVEHYRAASGITIAYREGHAGTEDLRQAMIHYRALFEDLLETAPDRDEIMLDLREQGVRGPGGGR